MTWILLALICLCLPGLSPVKSGIRDDYMEKRNTQAVNGIFVLLVFMRHFKNYISYGWDDRLFLLFDKCLGQLIVVSFLFYSGYGVMLSVCSKGDSYIRQFPVRRLLRVWYHFALAVLLYAAAALLSGKVYSPRRVLTSLTGWTSVGNSSWFMFTIFVLYLITWLCGRIFITRTQSRTAPFLAASAACVLFYMFLMSRVRQTYFYDTAFAWIGGMTFALCREHLETSLLEKRRRSVLLFLSAAAVLIASSIWKYFLHSIPADLCWSLSFALLLVLFTMKVRIGNPFLRYLGGYTFEIYILQRLPMKYLSGYIQNKYLLFVLSALVTLVLAQLFRKLTTKTDTLLQILYSRFSRRSSRYHATPP